MAWKEKLMSVKFIGLSLPWWFSRGAPDTPRSTVNPAPPPGAPWVWADRSPVLHRTRPSRPLSCPAARRGAPGLAAHRRASRLRARWRGRCHRSIGWLRWWLLRVPVDQGVEPLAAGLVLLADGDGPGADVGIGGSGPTFCSSSGPGRGQAARGGGAETRGGVG